MSSDPPPMRAHTIEQLQLAEMLQSIVQDMEVDAIFVAVTAVIRAEADATEDAPKRRRLRWYTRQLVKLAAGPPSRLGGAVGIEEMTPRERIEAALSRIHLRVNRLRDRGHQLSDKDRRWVDALGPEMGALITKLERWRKQDWREDD